MLKKCETAAEIHFCDKQFANKVLIIFSFRCLNFKCKSLSIHIMGISLKDKLQIRTLQEQKFCAKAIVAAY